MGKKFQLGPHVFMEGEKCSSNCCYACEVEFNEGEEPLMPCGYFFEDLVKRHGEPVEIK